MSRGHMRRLLRDPDVFVPVGILAFMAAVCWLITGGN